MSKQLGKAKLGLGLSCVLYLAGCAVSLGPFIAKKDHPELPIKYCISAIRHMAGSKPWILRGTCCCTPTNELMKQYQKDGFCLDMTKDDLIKRYHNSGITLDIDHKGCNNMCDHGPHVVKGGKCMSTPTVATKNFEEVITGVRPAAIKKNNEE